ITANRISTETPNSPAYSTVTRKLEVRSTLGRMTDTIAGTAHGLDQLRLEPLVDLAAQSTDIGLDAVGARIEMEIPDMLEQHRARHHLPGMPHQIFEQPEFARLQVDDVPGPAHRAREQVEFEIGNLQAGRDRMRRRAAQQGPDPRDQLGKGKGLDQIIVAAGIETRYPIVDPSERRQKQDRSPVAGGAQRLDNGKAVETRQHPIDDQKVEMLRGGAEQPFIPARRTYGQIALLGETVDDIVRRVQIIFDHQDLHRTKRPRRRL